MKLQSLLKVRTCLTCGRLINKLLNEEAEVGAGSQHGLARRRGDKLLQALEMVTAFSPPSEGRKQHAKLVTPLSEIIFSHG